VGQVIVARHDLAGTAKWVSLACGSAVTLVGIGGLLGWAFDVDRLKHLGPSAATMKANTALSFALSALAFVLASCALGLSTTGRALPQQLAATAALVIAAGTVLGYLYGADLTRTGGTTAAATTTMGALTALGLGLLLLKPREALVGGLLGDEPGGLMARWLLMAGGVTLPLLGALRLVGQHHGLYTAGLGVVIMVIAALLALAITVTLTARRLNALGRTRTEALRSLAESDRRLRATLDRLLQVQQTERKALAEDLHDDTLPVLGAVALQLESAREQTEDSALQQRLGGAELELRAVSTRLRHLIFDLVPEALAREGLGQVLLDRLEQMRRLTGIDYELYDRLEREPSRQAAAILYRVALEALRNVSKHSEAAVVRVMLERRDGHVQVTVADDGVGLGTSPREPGHLGLSLMTERAELAGGGVEIKWRPNDGTTVVCWLPASIQQTVDAG
jgi:signal transduction histidine kinase